MINKYFTLLDYQKASINFLIDLYNALYGNGTLPIKDEQLTNVQTNYEAWFYYGNFDVMFDIVEAYWDANGMLHGEGFFYIYKIYYIYNYNLIDRAIHEVLVFIPNEFSVEKFKDEIEMEFSRLLKYYDDN